MRRWVARLVDFLGESIRVGLLGQTWVGTLTKIATVLLVTLGAPFGLQSTVKVAHTMLGQYEVSLGTLLASAFLLIWISASCGYAWARSPWIALRMADQLVIDPDYHYFCLHVWNDGFGVVQPAVYVTDVVDAQGCRLLPAGLGRLEIHWRGSHQERAPLSHDGGRGHMLGLLQVLPLALCRPVNAAEHYLALGIMGGEYKPIDCHIPIPQRRKFWLRVAVWDPNKERVARWFAITPNLSLPMCYEATTEDPPVLPAIK